jgi:hypothetical protein
MTVSNDQKEIIKRQIKEKLQWEKDTKINSKGE